MSATFKCGDDRYTVTIKKEPLNDKLSSTVSEEVYEQLSNPSEIVNTYFLQS
tara:strand:- start:800 stop:955 length:156 start_codon:yes stop_codon:yes gene_type:complete